MCVEEMLKGKSIEEIKKEIESLDKLLADIKGKIAEIEEKAKVNREYDELRRILQNAVFEIRKIKSCMFKVLGKRVYESLFGDK